MTEHYTLNTVEVTAWCNTCKKITRHSVSGKLRGPCLEHNPAGLSKEQGRRKKAEGFVVDGQEEMKL